MLKLPALGELSDLKEICRGALVTIHEAQVDGVKMTVETLTEDGAENRREFHRQTVLQARLGQPGMPSVRHTGITEEGLPYRVKERLDGKPVFQPLR